MTVLTPRVPWHPGPVPERMPTAEVDIGPELVRTLLSDQHPDLADRPLSLLANGWDNVLLRLGDDLVVRLPRRAAAADLVRHEQRWLPHLAPRLPLPVPAPVRTGGPTERFPWSWSVVRYLPGDVAARTPPHDADSAAQDLATFLGALHSPAPKDAPRSPVRGVPLPARAEAVAKNLGAARRILPPGTADHLEAVWHTALSAPGWPSDPVWCHGDLHPANVLVDDGRISAVIDFGDLTAGDPATDLSVAWSLVAAEARPRFWAAYADAGGPVDDALLLRAGGWATSLALVLVTHSADMPLLDRVGRATLAAVLTD